MTALLSTALLLGLLTACGPASAEESPAGDAPSAAANEDQGWRAPEGPAPWDDGWPREWFYAHPRPADDWRWARMAQHVGHPAPELEGLVDWRNGEATSLADLRGRYVLLDFWATWCSDCARSTSTVNAAAERLADDLTVIQVCATKGGERFAKTVDQWGLESLTALDADGTSEALYDVPRWPFYVLIDREGIVRAPGVRTAHLDAALDHLVAQG